MFNDEETSDADDLINFNAKSPPPILNTEPVLDSVSSENLLDAELPELEQKLQTSSYGPVNNYRSNSIDVEDILISIDDDYEQKSVAAKNCVEEISQLEFNPEDLEAIQILNGLDDFLNIHLQDTIYNKSDEWECMDPATQQSIEDCLNELDVYLRDLDSSLDSEHEVQDGSVTKTPTKITVENNADISLRRDNYESLRKSLRKIEENYNKYLSYGKINKSYVKTEDEIESLKCNSLSSRCKQVEAWRDIRTHFVNAVSTLPMTKKKIQKTSRLPVLNFTERNAQSERSAQASGETSVVEDNEAASSQSSSVSDVDRAGMSNVHQPKDECKQTNSTWLRASMRQLRHLQLPNDSIQERNETQRVQVPASEEPVATTPTRSDIDENVLPEEDRLRSRNSVLSAEPGRQGGRSSSASSVSRRQPSMSSSGSSLTSSLETASSAQPRSHDRTSPLEGRRTCDRGRSSDMPEASSPLGQWPHSLSSTLACLSCSLGLFNISRFAVLSIHFGSNFILQFMILSMVFGLPLYTLQMCLGQQLAAGVIDMWRISPLFQGVGVSLFLAQALIGVYSIIGVSWMFVFFRDSFITRMDRYKWAEPFVYYRNAYYTSVNSSHRLHETIPDYFNGIVLQRHHLSSGTEYGTIKFQLAFNLAVVWMIVFVSLSKGLKSYGKVIFVFTLVPVFGMFILCAKLMGMMPTNSFNNIFPESDWNEFFLNSRSWLAAAQETFLTWGLLGAAVMQITSHNKDKNFLQRDSSLVAVITFIVLLLVAFLANTCVHILRAGGYNYIPSSFERMNSYIFLRPHTEPLPTSLGNTPLRYMIHNSFIVGEKVVRPFMDPTIESGYQVLRLGTELIPATFAVLGSERISSFWAVLFYFILILFGIAQQLAIWHSVITGIMAIKAKILKSWETTITFFSCSFAFLLGLPMATELGIYVVYVLDYTVGGIWWLLTIIFLQIVAVFMVRGRPYSGDNVVTALFASNINSCLAIWISPLLSFVWNVVLPVSLVILCISTFKNGHFRELFVWHLAPVAEYWPLVVRQIGSILQLLPVICVPVVAVIQSYRYLNNGPSDILERIQLLYRPPIGDHMDDLAIQEAAAASRLANNNIISEDPPPKYTPPPSYTTATGARLAKFLRQSIRRSVRRLANVLGESSNVRQRPTVQQTQLPPPDYSTVLVEMNETPSLATDDVGSREIRISTLERLRSLQPVAGSSAITAAEVACILRSSFRRSNIRRNQAVSNDTDNQFDNSVASLSAENLIDCAAPIGETSLVFHNLPNGHEDNENKTTVI